MIALGMPVIADTNCYKTERWQVRFPRSKKKRVRRKFAKNLANWDMKVIPQAYQFNGVLYAHPITTDQLRKGSQ